MSYEFQPKSDGFYFSDLEAKWHKRLLPDIGWDAEFIGYRGGCNWADFDLGCDIFLEIKPSRSEVPGAIKRFREQGHGTLIIAPTTTMWTVVRADSLKEYEFDAWGMGANAGRGDFARAVRYLKWLWCHGLTLEDHWSRSFLRCNKNGMPCSTRLFGDDVASWEFYGRGPDRWPDGGAPYVTWLKKSSYHVHLDVYKILAHADKYYPEFTGQVMPRDIEKFTRVERW